MDPDWFDETTSPDWDTALWLALADAFGGPVLELGCGTGRVLSALRRAGHDGWGVELDPELAARARQRVGDRIACADLTTWRWPRQFPLVIVPCNTMSLFPDPTSALAAAADQLRPGGTLVFDVVVPEGRPWGYPPHCWRRATEGGRFDPVERRHDGFLERDAAREEVTTWYLPLDQWPATLARCGLTHRSTLDPAGRPAGPSAPVAVVVSTR